jgi:hypothetical protein
VKKRKVILLDSEQLSKQDSDAICELQEGLNKVDQFPVYTPDLQWFEQIVLAEQENARKKLIRDVAIFALVAVVILSGIIVSLYHMPVIFIILQISTTVFMALYTGVRFIKQVSNE